MKQITIRGIPDDIERKARREAERKGLSFNKAFLSLLKTSAGTKERKKRVLHHELDHLCGIWTKEEAEVFQKHLGFQRRIDEDLWKKTE